MITEQLRLLHLIVSQQIVENVLLLIIYCVASTLNAVNPTDHAMKGNASQQQISEGTNQLDLLLSLDIALELIHATREALKRVEAFAGYPGHYGHRVRDTVEELFILMLQTLGERHVTKGFAQWVFHLLCLLPRSQEYHRATERMTAYKPADHQETTSVAPLVQFFELVHIGDMIQSMVQVFFDKELVGFRGFCSGID